MQIAFIVTIYKVFNNLIRFLIDFGLNDSIVQRKKFIINILDTLIMWIRFIWGFCSDANQLFMKYCDVTFVENAIEWNSYGLLSSQYSWQLLSYKPIYNYYK